MSHRSDPDGIADARRGGPPTKRRRRLLAPGTRALTLAHDFAIGVAAVATAFAIGVVTHPAVGALVAALLSALIHAAWPSARARDAARQIASLQRDVVALSARPDWRDPLARIDAERAMRARGWRS